MSALSLLDAIERPSILGIERDEPHVGARALPDDAGHHRRVGQDDADDREGATPEVGGAPTLDDLLTGVWDALTAERPASCPMCGGHLEARYGSGHAPVAGRCTNCGTELS